jgi:hypothetical protein
MTKQECACAVSALGEQEGQAAAQRGQATVILNADDWGLDAETTGRTLDCVLRGSISSVSAMVFMEDSERAAVLARRHGIDVGLHLNLTAPFSAPQCSSELKESQRRIARFLRWHRFAPVVYNPVLASAFRSVVEAQLEEFERLYGHPVTRVDGHHHMHLCSNVTLGKLLPAGIMMRRNFSFSAGEKGYFNRCYRRWQDRALARRYRLTDYFFCLTPLDSLDKLRSIFALAARSNVEVEAHLQNEDEYRFLMDGGLTNCIGDFAVAQGYLLRAGDGHAHDEVLP